MSPLTKFSKLHKNQITPIYLISLWSISQMVKFLKENFIYSFGWYQRCSPITYQNKTHKFITIIYSNLSILIQIFWPYYVMIDWTFQDGYSFGSYQFFIKFFKAMFFSYVPSMMLGMLYISNAMLNHATEINVEEDSDKYETDWFKAQVLHSSNHSNASRLMFILTGGLCLQIEHHLFPGISHIHLLALQPKIKEICLKHNVRYNTFDSFYLGLKNHFEFSAKLSIPPEDCVNGDVNNKKKAL
mmetsp:Transcript_11754/g.15140  ORF Transcript_11754/g.15140 Transcript_11754/m.15140 type:complete len:243 (+) Transcript_11754:1125-1853(+)